MKIYKLQSDYDNFFSFTIDNIELFSKMPNFSHRLIAKSRINEWIPPNIEFYKSANYCNSRTQIPDITLWGCGNIILNEKSHQSLSKEMKTFGEFLNCHCEGIPYYIFNTLTIIPDEYIDTEKTRANEEMGFFTGLESLGFKDFDPDSYMLFKTSADKMVYTYCTDKFYDLVKNAQLKGLIFNNNLCGY